MQYNSGFVSYKNLPASCDDADVVVVSSTASSFTILPQFFTTNKPRLILDLSIPQNVEPSVKDMPGITLLNVDEVSTILDKTISRRQAEVPKAMKIIEDTLNSLADWHRQQANNPLLIKVKSQIVQLTEAYFNNNYDEEKIHKTVSFLAIQLKNKKNKGCQCINALSSYLQTNYEKTP
jgi:glutamyl-tRNA reductase